MDNQNMVYMAYDGDNAGRLCGRAILADNPDALHEVSARIQLGHEVVKKWVEAHGGQFISGGGDEGVFSIPVDAIANVEELRADYHFATNLTTTIGIGKTLSEAGKAMLVGKFRGKNTVVQFEPAIEQEIKQAQAHIAGGTGSQEENKIGEAYLQPEGTVSTMQNENKSEGAAPAAHDDCPYCNEMDAQQVDDPNHCRYCHDAEAQAEEPCPYCATPHAAQDSGHPDDCPYCAGMAAHDPAAEGHPDDCPYCASAGSRGSAAGGDDQSVTPTAGPTVNSPTTTDSQNYAGQDLNQPDLPKPDAIQANPDGLGSTIDSPTNNNVALEVEGQGAHNETTGQAAEAADPQSEETVESIAQQLTETPVDAQSEAPAQDPVDAANLAPDTTMQENVSRPPDYDNQNRPADMGLGEEEQGPDIGGLMQEGLDAHADNIQREKVITLVSEALEGFKQCKGILEKAKQQAPQLYESSIAMLKAMIEMAKMMGLDKEAGSPDGNDPLGDGVANTDGHPEYEQANEGGPAPAGNGADDGTPLYEQAQEKPAEGAPEKKSEGAVGQPIGKLPTSQTTKHVARTPQFPGATNAKGQKKVIDPVTGKVRWIDMKEGKVQSETGVPVKPAEIKQEGAHPKEPKQKK